MPQEIWGPQGGWWGRLGFCSPLPHAGNPERASVSPLSAGVGTGAGRGMSRVSRALGTPYAGQDGANGLCGAGLGAIPSRAQNTPAALTHPHPRGQARGQEELEGPQGPPLGKAASRAGRKPTAPGVGGQGAGGGLCVCIWGAVHVHACGCVSLLAGSGCARVCVHVRACACVQACALVEWVHVCCTPVAAHGQ